MNQLASLPLYLQYFTPYLSADLNRMAKSFTTSVPELENELAELIQKGCIKARIDSHKQVRGSSQPFAAMHAFPMSKSH